MTEETPLKRLGNTNDIANAILYLVSEESSFVTGTELLVDGGRGAERSALLGGLDGTEAWQRAHRVRAGARDADGDGAGGGECTAAG